MLEKVHPNDDVNKSQSSNDTYPQRPDTPAGRDTVDARSGNQWMEIHANKFHALTAHDEVVYLHGGAQGTGGRFDEDRQ